MPRRYAAPARTVSPLPSVPVGASDTPAVIEGGCCGIRYRPETPMRWDVLMAGEPITVSIRREVDPERIAEATAWVQTGVDMANKYPGFLGSGWVRVGEHSQVW